MLVDGAPLVNLYIIGEQKCGTTSLYLLLARHPEILVHEDKECHYFESKLFEKDKNYADYHRMFERQVSSNNRFCMDATPDYFFSDGVAERVFKYNPESRLIVILRNPVIRFISAYNFYFSNVANNLEAIYEKFFRLKYDGDSKYKYIKENLDISLEEFLDDELEGHSSLNVLARGNYSKSFSEWKRYFGAEKICALFFENLTDNRKSKAELQRIIKFLGLAFDSGFPHENKSLLSTKPNSEITRKLINYYERDRHLLEGVIGRKLPW